MQTITIIVHSTMKPKTTCYDLPIIKADTRIVHVRGDLAAAERELFTQKLQKKGLISKHDQIHSMEGWILVEQSWLISRYFDRAGTLLGTYCDVVSSPLRITDGYEMRDLVVDIWLDAAGTWRELDWDEYAHAVADGKLDQADQHTIASAMHWMRDMLNAGNFEQQLT